jgi:hypothetical protein
LRNFLIRRIIFLLILPSFTLLHYGVIYAGSSFYVKFTVNNPDDAMKQKKEDNEWSFDLTAKGAYSDDLTTTKHVFKAIEANYTNTVAVLG